MDLLLGAKNNQSALYTLEVSKLFGNDSPFLFQDIMRMLCIQTMIQACFALSQPGYAFWTEDFVAVLTYVVLGVMLYWLVMRKLFAFSS